MELPLRGDGILAIIKSGLITVFGDDSDNDLLISSKWKRQSISRRFRSGNREVQFMSYYYGSFAVPHVIALLICLVFVLISLSMNILLTDIASTVASIATVVEASAMVIIIIVMSLLMRVGWISWNYILGELFDIVMSMFAISLSGLIYIGETGLAFDRSETTLIISSIGFMLFFRQRVFPYTIIVCVLASCANLFFVMFALDKAGGTMIAMEMTVRVGAIDIVGNAAASTLRIACCLCIASVIEDTVRGLFVSTEEEKETLVILNRIEDNERRLLETVYPRCITVNNWRDEYIENVTTIGVIVNDISGFTSYSESQEPEDVMGFLNKVYTIFDDISTVFRIEKVRTDGDSWVGISFEQKGDISGSSTACLKAACLMLSSFTELVDSDESYHALGLRTGVSVGRLSVFVFWSAHGLGFTFDVLGDAYDEASSLEPIAESGQILCSTHVKNSVECCEFRPVELDETYVWEVVKFNLDPDETDSLVTSQCEDSSEVSRRDMKEGADESCAKKNRCVGVCAFLSFLLCYRITGDHNILYEKRRTMKRMCFAIAIAMAVSCLVTIIISTEYNNLASVLVTGTMVTLCLLSIASSATGLCLTQVVSPALSNAMEWLSFALMNCTGLIVFTTGCIVDQDSFRSLRLMQCAFDMQTVVAMFFPSIPIPLKVLVPIIVLIPSMATGIPFSRLGMHAADAFLLWLVSVYALVWYNYFLFSTVYMHQRTRVLLDKVKKQSETNRCMLRGVIPLSIVKAMKGAAADTISLCGGVYNGGILFAYILTESRRGATVNDLKNAFPVIDKLVAATRDTVTKIKSAGNRYIAVTGISASCGRPLRRLLAVAMGAARCCNNVYIGMHYGRFSGGVCGSKMCPFDVLGDPINVACRLSEKATSSTRVLYSGEFVKAWREESGVNGLFSMVEEAELHGRIKSTAVYSCPVDE